MTIKTDSSHDSKDLDHTHQDSEGGSRRNLFISISVWLSSLFVLILGSGVSLRFLLPPARSRGQRNIRYRNPSSLPQGWTHLKKDSVYLWREGQPLKAMSGICTHLGCTVHRDQKNDLYHCPCHGSRFNPKGEVLDGPAPKNLPWLAVNLSPDGTLLIHPSRHVSQDFKITI